MKANSICYTCIKSQWSSGLLLIKLAGRTTITKVTGIMQFNECQARYIWFVQIACNIGSRGKRTLLQNVWTGYKFILLFYCNWKVSDHQFIHSINIKCNYKLYYNVNNSLYENYISLIVRCTLCILKKCKEKRNTHEIGFINESH